MEKILTLARGWGSRGSGLGLHACVATTTEDINKSLPKGAGDLRFEFYVNAMDATTTTTTAQQTNYVSAMHSTPAASASAAVPPASSSASSSSASSSSSSGSLVSVHVPGSDLARLPTARLFHRLKSQYSVPSDKLFGLLAAIRLAKSFHDQPSRVAAVSRRLEALLTVLHIHSSSDVLVGYFQAQPELCHEIVDLVRPSEDVGGGGGTATTRAGPIPMDLQLLAMDVLAALVSQRDDASGGLGPIGRAVNVFQELGVGKGQYMGLLPSLLRYSLAALNEAAAMPSAASQQRIMQSQQSQQSQSQSQQPLLLLDEEHLSASDLSLGLAFVSATSPTGGRLAARNHHEPHSPRVLVSVEESLLLWIDAVFNLISSVVAVPSGAAAMTDCGLVPALLSIFSLGAPSSLETLSLWDGDTTQQQQRGGAMTKSSSSSSSSSSASAASSFSSSAAHPPPPPAVPPPPPPPRSCPCRP